MRNYFTDSELRCKCCGLNVIDEDFLDRLNRARELAGFPVNVNSGCRCEKHNRAVGSTSLNHVSGKAADIKCHDSCERFHMVGAMITAGMLGIGIGKDFVHCDTNRTTPCIWTY